MNHTPISLAINTSLKSGQLCLFEGEKVLAETCWDQSGSHSEVISLKFAELLRTNGLASRDIVQIFCVTGPGSFTGLRVAVNFAKTLAYSIEIPVAPINSLDLLCLNALKTDCNVVCVIDAQKNSVFASEFSHTSGVWESVYRNRLCSLQKAAELIGLNKEVCGSGLLRYVDFLPTELQMNLKSTQDSGDLKNIFSKQRPFDLTPAPWQQLQTVYIKTSAAEEKRRPTSIDN